MVEWLDERNEEEQKIKKNHCDLEVREGEEARREDEGSGMRVVISDFETTPRFPVKN